MNFSISRSGIEEKFYFLCEKVVKDLGVEVYALHYQSPQQLLRIFIENPETTTATLEECASVDRALSPYIEEEEWMPEELTLEVSSPGVYRDIYEGKNFQRFVGQRVMVNLNNKVARQDLIKEFKDMKRFVGQKRLMGYITTANDNGLSIANEKDGEAILNINYENIKKANLEPLWEEIKEN